MRPRSPLLVCWPGGHSGPRILGGCYWATDSSRFVDQVIPCVNDEAMDTRTISIIALVIGVIVAIAVFTTVL